jgi:hypothetical protein
MSRTVNRRDKHTDESRITHTVYMPIVWDTRFYTTRDHHDDE